MLIFLLSMQILMKNMKKQWKDCLEGEHEEIDTQYSRINQQVWSISYLKFQKDYYTVSQHQKPTKACFEQFPGKKEQSNGFHAWPENMKGWKYH